MKCSQYTLKISVVSRDRGTRHFENDIWLLHTNHKKVNVFLAKDFFMHKINASWIHFAYQFHVYCVQLARKEHDSYLICLSLNEHNLLSSILIIMYILCSYKQYLFSKEAFCIQCSPLRNIDSASVISACTL